MLIRIVVDTNLFVSGTISRLGAPYLLLDWLATHPSVLIMSTSQEREIREVFRRPKIARRFHVDDPVRAMLDVLLETVERVDVSGFELPIQVRDEDDAAILASALAGQADFLVTGDSDLLVLADDPRLSSLRIVTARELLDILPS